MKENKEVINLRVFRAKLTLSECIKEDNSYDSEKWSSLIRQDFPTANNMKIAGAKAVAVKDYPGDIIPQSVSIGLYKKGTDESFETIEEIIKKVKGNFNPEMDVEIKEVVNWRPSNPMEKQLHRLFLPLRGRVINVISFLDTILEGQNKKTCDYTTHYLTSLNIMKIININ